MQLNLVGANLLANYKITAECYKNDIYNNYLHKR